MTTEEKAKAYDEAIEKLRSLHDNYDTVSTLIDIKEELENIFPQLKESEDERIRKWLIGYLENKILNSVIIDERKNCQDAVAWLEEQGKHYNFRQKIQVGDHVTRNDNGELVNLSQLKRVAVKENKGNYGGISPNSEWSEEDKKRLESIIEECSFHKGRYKHGIEESAYYTLCEKNISWLKSLKERVQPQNIAYYNPYKEVVESIAEMCKHYDKASHSGLRDLYDNVKVKCKDAKEYDSLYPHNTWKPSDEHYELEEFAKIVRGNLTGISKAVQELFKAKYLQLTGNKMYGGYKD